MDHVAAMLPHLLGKSIKFVGGVLDSLSHEARHVSGRDRQLQPLGLQPFPGKQIQEHGIICSCTELVLDCNADPHKIT